MLPPCSRIRPPHAAILSSTSRWAAPIIRPFPLRFLPLTSCHTINSRLSSTPSCSRSFSLSATAFSSSANSSPVSVDEAPPPSSRWYADLRARIGKCLMFGCNHTQIARSSDVLRAIATEWRNLAAGSEGFLTGGRRGLEGQQVVWGEMDSFGHVNNAHYLRYAESSRVNWILHFGAIDATHRSEWEELMTPRGTGLIMKSIKADYKFPMTYPDTISVYHKLHSLPSGTDTSLVLDSVILSHRHRRVAARTAEDVVVYDYRRASKTPIPAFALDLFRDTWRRQEEERGRARGRIRALTDEVRRLERETWDREDAVEDLGSATVRR